MNTLPSCPKCECQYTYEDQGLIVCPECSYEWSSTLDLENSEKAIIYKDAHGTELKDGDTVTLIKDLKLGGTSSTLKVGTKVKNIRLVDSDHNIDCKVSGVGAIKLKSEFVKKV